ncbi:MAG: hypothetical protein K2P84_07025 [Undibacterium sp.]|nr:hypothetical protein [Undibacterium sp.]
MLKLKDFFKRFFQRQSHVAISDATRQFIVLAHDEMIEENKKHAATWQYGKEKSWVANLDAGVISFTFSKELTGTTPFQSIGIYDDVDKSFTWAWAHSSTPKKLRSHANIAKEWGHTHHPSFTTKKVYCSMEEAWSYAAVTRKLAGAKGVYRGRLGSNYIFMTTEDISIQAQVEQAHWAAGRRNTSW